MSESDPPAIARHKRADKKDPPDGQVLKHLGLWDINPPSFWRVESTPPPKRANAPPVDTHLD